MLQLNQIPSTLVGLRFVIALLLVLDALDGQSTIWFIVGSY